MFCFLALGNCNVIRVLVAMPSTTGSVVYILAQIIGSVLLLLTRQIEDVYISLNTQKCQLFNAHLFPRFFVWKNSFPFSMSVVCPSS